MAPTRLQTGHANRNTTPNTRSPVSIKTRNPLLLPETNMNNEAISHNGIEIVTEGEENKLRLPETATKQVS